jgi:hypothetical protein
MVSPYTLPSNEDALTGACAFKDGLCAWAGPAAYRWGPEAGWTSLSEAPTAIESGFELQSGVLAGAGTHIGFLPADGADWAGWVDLSTFSDAHPMYGDLLLCIDAGAETYTLFSVSTSGLEPLSTFDAAELADPVAGWSAPANPDRVLLLGEGGLWALNPPYTAADRQHLVSFDDMDLPAFENIPAPFQPGPATVVVPRRHRTGLRLDLSDGSGHATGLAHLPGGGALWWAYLQDDRATAERLLAAIARLPDPSSSGSLRLHDMLMSGGTVEALATSAGLFVPSQDQSAGTPSPLLEAPLDPSRLATWGLWLDTDETLEAACRRLCDAPEPDYALVESLQVFAGAEVLPTLFDLLRSEDPPGASETEVAFPPAALRALVVPFPDDGAEVVSSALTSSSVPVRAAACVMAGALPSDAGPENGGDEADEPVLWGDDRPPPEKALLANTQHDHPAVRVAARDTCARLSIEEAPAPQP